MKTLFFVGLWGGVGSMLRYLTQIGVNNRFPSAVFPYGTLVVNILGCLMIGVVYGLALRCDWFTPQMRLFFATGLCGGYTTFSAFAYENISLFQTGHHLQALVYIVASFVLCLAATFAGLWLMKSI